MYTPNWLPDVSVIGSLFRWNLRLSVYSCDTNPESKADPNPVQCGVSPLSRKSFFVSLKTHDKSSEERVNQLKAQ